MLVEDGFYASRRDEVRAVVDAVPGRRHHPWVPTALCGLPLKREGSRGLNRSLRTKHTFEHAQRAPGRGLLYLRQDADQC